MAEASWPSPAHNSRAVNDIEYEQLASPVYGDGLVGTAADTPLIYGDSTGRQVKIVANRFALVRAHEWSSGSSIVTKAVTANSSGSTRIDLAVLGLDRSTWSVTCYIKLGTPGAGVPPALQLDVGTTGIYEIPLASISVANGASTITAGNVTPLAWYVSGSPISCTSTTRPGHRAGLIIAEYDTGLEYMSSGAAWILIGGTATRNRWITINRTTSLSVVSATSTLVSWDGVTAAAAEVVNADYWSASNASRLLIPTTAIYEFVIPVLWANGNAGDRSAFLALNGNTSNRVFESVAKPTSSTTYSGHTLHWKGPLTAGDYVELYLWQTQGSNLSVTAGKPLYATVTRYL